MSEKIKLTGSSSFTNLGRALANLRRSLSTPIAEPRDLSGIIKDFEMTYELCWKVLKKKLESDGIITKGPKDVFIRAFQNNYINDETDWLNMIEDRNQAVHVYDENTAKALVEKIRNIYLNQFNKTFDL